MSTSVEESRAELLGKAAHASEKHGCAEGELEALLRRYYRHVADDDLRQRDPVDLAGAVLSHRRLAALRTPGSALVRVFTPDVDSHGWRTGHTVVQVVIEDMPFLVDSVTADLTGQGRAIHLVVHPVIVVRRTPTGELIEVLDTSTSGLATGQRGADWPDDAVAESWMHLEIDRDPDPDSQQRVAKSLTKVLQDVRSAVEDWPQMRESVRTAAESLVEESPDDLADEAREAQRLLEWLVDGNFTFLGYRAYDLVGEAGDESLEPKTGSGLGILRHHPAGASESFSRLTDHVREKARERTILVLTKANSRATVHRPTYLDYVGVKVFGPDGQVTGERRLLGLFTSAAYTDSVRRVPVIDRKVDQLLERAGLAPDSHSGKDLLTIMETYPRDELFQTGIDVLYETVMSVLQLQERRRTKLFLRNDDYGRFVSALVFLPRDRYTTAVRLRMQEILTDTFGAESVDHTTRVSESVLARLHFVVRLATDKRIPDVDASLLEARLVEATRSWEEDFADSLSREVGESESSRLVRRWGAGFPEAYKEDFPARSAVADLRRIERVVAQEQVAAQAARAEGARGLRRDGDGVDMALNMYEPVGGAPDERRVKLFRGSTLSLTSVLPFFRNLGLEVVDERPYELATDKGETAYVYDFGLRLPAESASDATRAMVTDAFTAAWSGATESDGFDQLVLGAGLTWREVVVLRAYAKYLRQTGSTFSQEYVERVLLGNAEIARLLVQLFAARFDPDAGELAGPDRDDAADTIVEQVTVALDAVDSLDADRILRSLLGLVQATVRTSFYQVDEQGRDKPSVAFKLDPRRVPDLPEPRPAHEIWVYSPRVEGVHLRFGKVARGGLRWSDRREDFRTEILGLVKAQMVKNAVIVPTGAKGGFVAKQLPDGADRETTAAEGVASYRLFISSLLDVTDDLVPDPSAEGGLRVEPPPRVVRHDDDDTYLVVAADKGTASFSDIANEVAGDYGFWLGDAFASGGSVGYDHKAMGITARGAWESVKRHFREMGVDVQAEPFTAVGVGDMSGDVFGNGMLLSDQIRLVAAFDHRHLFLDPDPDPATSVAERRRLFELSRSSWADYDTSLISAGGGVYPRSAKSVPISPQVADRLGLSSDISAMTPAELMRAILRSPADLLWNGGIGTYVKASTEPHGAAGDRANDAIRVDGSELRVRVVGEGGNLGLTQLGRIEAALNGVRLNTDAIDNSAGVDCSDHEVNIKILLDQVVADGDLTAKQRNELLASMTDDVARLVLRDNYEQNVLLGNARRQSAGMLSVHVRMLRAMEAADALDRDLEFLPNEQQIEERVAKGLGLTSPESSVLAAYAKITLGESLLHSDVVDDPWFQAVLRRYFPQRLVDRYADRLSGHPLSREIIATWVVNDLVNRGGITFVFRAMEETGGTADQIVRAYTVAREVYGLEEYVACVESLDNVVTTDAQTDLYLELRRLIDRTARWILQNRPGEIDVQAEIERFSPAARRWRGGMDELLVGSERERLLRHRAGLVDDGVDEATANRASGLLYEFSLLDITEVATVVSQPLEAVAAVYYPVSERYGVDAMLTSVAKLGRTNRWEALARGALRDDLYSALMGLTRSVLTTTADSGDLSPQERIEQWESVNAAQLSRAQTIVDEVRQLEEVDLASMSVALRVLRGVIRAGSAT